MTFNDAKYFLRLFAKVLNEGFFNNIRFVVREKNRYGRAVLYFNIKAHQNTNRHSDHNF